MAKGAKRPLQLPNQQLLILAACRLAEPVASTSVYPYIPEMIQSFNVGDDQVAQWAGLMSATFSLSQCLTGVAWGRASDRFGRKPIIIVALTCTMLSSILFGFSKNLAWAFITRSLQGLSNGNVGIIRTAVAELVPQKELQPRAFSIMPLVWNVGSVFGPSVGGTLVHPAERYPQVFGKMKLLQEYPFALPNLLISVLFMGGITAGFLFLQETLEEKRTRRDYGLILGRFLTRPCVRRPHQLTQENNEESEAFLSGISSEMSTPVSGSQHAIHSLPKQTPGWGEVFSRQSNINLLVYTFLAMHSVAYDQLLAIFMHYPVQSIHDPDVRLPFKFAGGFGIDSKEIGLLFTAYGVFGMIIQFFVFPPFARKYGVLNCLKACCVAFPLAYIATPYTALLPTNSLRQGVMMVIMLIKCFCGIFAFPCSTILLTNSAASLKILGTLNGVATSISALGRAAGPALAGLTFTEGVDIGYVIISWWTLALVAVIGAVPVWFLVEMEGFGDSQEDDSDDEVDIEEDDDAKASAISSSDAHLRKHTPSSVFEDAVEDDQLTPEGSLLRPSNPPSRRQSLQLRRVSSPIGLGPGVIPHGARRYSSELGATRSGFGVGGTAYN
ncbi:MFS transporter [Cladophialophora carrionii]|uniref:MFS transporter n=1 Tax=Cladophialophora carrionii TaxID=86049 RepID=A0A1C1CLW9_9EURO|nr:MFS transporter [Cladophialophora carrionii]